MMLMGSAVVPAAATRGSWAEIYSPCCTAHSVMLSTVSPTQLRVARLLLALSLLIATAAGLVAIIVYVPSWLGRVVIAGALGAAAAHLVGWVLPVIFGRVIGALVAVTVIASLWLDGWGAAAAALTGAALVAGAFEVRRRQSERVDFLPPEPCRPALRVGRGEPARRQHGSDLGLHPANGGTSRLTGGACSWQLRHGLILTFGSVPGIDGSARSPWFRWQLRHGLVLTVGSEPGIDGSAGGPWFRGAGPVLDL